MDAHHAVLEFPKILALLAEKTTSPVSAERALLLTPSADPESARDAMRRTSDIRGCADRFGAPSLGGLPDCREILRRARLGSRLDPPEILQTARTLRAVREMKDWRGRIGEATAADDLFRTLLPVRGLEEDIVRSVLPEGELADDASGELSAVRRRIRRAQAGIREQLERLLRRPSCQHALQEAIVTIRDGRFVVPVKAGCRNEIRGLIHDTSASGSTVFIEPMAVVEANNEIRLLRQEEQAEIRRILDAFSARIGENASSIAESFDALVGLDLLFAKARLADAMNASAPELNGDGIIDFRRARHPLLPKDTVVPVDIALGEDYDTLVITGPNTGGKTVALKTLGLLTLMAACGLMIPAAPGSRAAVFARVFADIGDEQSIEQSLSTFSSHLTKIIGILSAAGKDSLVLTDELGAGTDPVEGAALAVAVLEALRARGARTAATTHYAEVKMFALETPGVENGCCEFDVATLSPTYRLLTGVPGRSNAFAICARLGLPEDIIRAARKRVSSENTRFEDVVSGLERTRRKLEEELTAAEGDRAEAARLRDEMDSEKKRQSRELAGLEEKARERARTLVERTRSRTDLLISELETLKKEKDRADFSEKVASFRQGYRKKVDELRDGADPLVPAETERKPLPRPLRAGDRVTVLSVGRQGVVLGEADRNGAYAVRLGNLRTICAPGDLELEAAPPVPKRNPPAPRAVRPDRAGREIRTELDIRGMTAEEGILELDRFLDRCRLAGVRNLTVIHGKGTGALRAAVQRHLRNEKSVKSQRPGLYGEGEAGVTVVELK